MAVKRRSPEEVRAYIELNYVVRGYFEGENGQSELVEYLRRQVENGYIIMRVSCEELVDQKYEIELRKRPSSEVTVKVKVENGNDLCIEQEDADGMDYCKEV